MDTWRAASIPRAQKCVLVVGRGAAEAKAFPRLLRLIVKAPAALEQLRPWVLLPQYPVGGLQRRGTIHLALSSSWRAAFNSVLPLSGAFSLLLVSIGGHLSGGSVGKK